MSRRRVGRRDARGRVAARARRRRAGRRRRRDRIASTATSTRSRRSVRVAPGEREQIAFYFAVGPERDGAEATASVLRRRGWRELLSSTRDALQSLEQSSGNEALDRLINRNLLFAYFYAVGRALDDAQYYLVRTRAPWNGHGVTVRDWEALTWTIPAVQLADPPLARELLLRMCELHGYAPGRGVHYLDGTLFEPGFALEGVASYPIAADRYIRDTGDDRVVDEPALADTLYLAAEDLDASSRQADSAVLDGSESVGIAGGISVHAARQRRGRAGARRAAPHARRGDGARAAGSRRRARRDQSTFRRRVERARRPSRRRSTSPDRRRSTDDPSASVFWLPMYEAVARQDSTYRRTVKAIDVTPHSFVQQCARLIGPDATAVLQWLRRAPLDGGLAAEVVDQDGRAVGNGGDAALSGLLAWTAWYAVERARRAAVEQ